MKKLFIMVIALILMCSFALNLCSCNIDESIDKQPWETENESLFETNDKSNSNTPNDTNIKVEGSEEDCTIQRFSSFDELLLAINDIDAFCEVVKNRNGAGQPVDKAFVKENLDKLVKYPFAYIDNYKSFYAELYCGVLHATFITEDETSYTFAYILITDFKGVEVDGSIIKMVIGDQLVELEKNYKSSYCELRGVWKNNDIRVTVSVVNYQKIPVDLENFSTIDFNAYQN